MKNKVIFVALLKCAGSIVGTWCTVLQVLPLMKITPPSFMQDIVTFVLMVMSVTLIYLLYFILHYIFRNYRIDESDIRICIRIGNILKVKNGSILIGVNDELTCDPQRIGENSIHKKLLNSKKSDIEKRCIRENSIHEKPLNAEMSDIEIRFAEERQKLSEQGTTKADYGYTFASSAQTNGKHYLFLVMSTILDANNVSTSPQNLKIAVRGFFDRGNLLIIKNGCAHMPIIGSGPAGVRFRREDIVKLIACEFINHTFSEPNHQIKRLVIQIRWKDIFDINVMEIAYALAWMANNCCCKYPKSTQREVKAS